MSFVLQKQIPLCRLWNYYRRIIRRFICWGLRSQSNYVRNVISWLVLRVGVSTLYFCLSLPCFADRSCPHGITPLHTCHKHILWPSWLCYIQLSWCDMWRAVSLKIVTPPPTLNTIALQNLWMLICLKICMGCKFFLFVCGAPKTFT